MKRILLALTFVAFGQIGLTQTFSASPGAAIPNLTTVTSTISVTGVGTIDCDYGLLEVCIDVNHTRDRDLDIFLIDPEGTSYELTTDNGGTGNNYIVTCFDMTAGTNVTAGSAPFNGSFVPEGNDLNLVNNGQDADGTWTLEVTDDRSGQTGTFNEWSITFGSTPPCPPDPTTEDCAGGITICSDATFSGNASGAGNFTDLDVSNEGCLFGENESSWYYFQAASAGTFAFEIVTAVDYDFAVWGPLTSIECPPVGAPLRCSYSGAGGNTGLQAGSGDDTEGAGGDGFVDPITAAEDDIFIILIDNFTSDGSTFDVVWTLTGGASLDCTPLPVELISFDVQAEENLNLLEWSTLSETNAAYYSVQRSEDGINWNELDQIPAAGNSSVRQDYMYRDYFHTKSVNYYRLIQVDFDGKKEDLGTVSIDNRSGKTIEKIINLMGEEVGEGYPGIKVYIYTDGSTAKIVSR